MASLQGILYCCPQQFMYHFNFSVGTFAGCNLVQLIATNIFLIKTEKMQWQTHTLSQRFYPGNPKLGQLARIFQHIFYYTILEYNIYPVSSMNRQAIYQLEIVIGLLKEH